MAYLALYRKWRPRTFSEVVGQKHISIPLQRAIEQDRLAHAYLFSGPRGTGKTSMAKILAKAVNCLHPNGANPCNECQSCREINEGSSLDVYEIDAASNRGIEEIRALKESVRTLPAVSRKKVYIIDEVHMLTKEAFNALLKTLEEPPAHVLFILATTEPEKIPLTILSRCQRYEFHRISVADIKEHLLYIAKESGLPLTEDAADLIAVRADGGLRDALSLLDQCSSASESKVLDAQAVYELLGLTGKDRILDLSHHIFNGKSGETLSLFYSILQEGKEPAAVLRDLLEHFRNLMICKINPKAPELTQYGKQIETLRSDASRLSEPYLDALFEELHSALSEAKRSSSPRLSAEMGLLHLCRIKGSASLDSLAERVTRLEAEVERLRKGISSSPSAQTYTPPVPRPIQYAVPPAMPPAPPAPMPETPPKQAAPSPMTNPPAGPEIPKPAAATVSRPMVSRSAAKTNPPPAVHPTNHSNTPSLSPSPAASPSTLINPASYSELWQKVLGYFMSIRRIDVFTCLRKSQLIYCTNTRAIVSAPQPFLVSAGNNPSYQKVAAEAFNKVTGHPIEMHTVLKGSEEEASAFALLKAPAPAQPATAPPERPQEKPDYRQVTRDEIPPSDRSNPSLNEALKIMTDCDIYEKTES
ncbi:DNA polymerase III subunit gamma/tau [uncultured Dialister sp.]|jgi:DNA polymerase-3 subunit gamma/tau|uniref:DNA polymerase III subunit gamma/tau n=1 Tax=Dialister sp. TaxID=1955814 RepID=UPI0025E6EAD6|nr:DNA polymerase III subunit gamma/tau [uncultured Dialister sp.]